MKAESVMLNLVQYDTGKKFKDFSGIKKMKKKLFFYLLM
jgi:hypothetical protein